MDNIRNLLKTYKGKFVLLIFPHPDDAAYVSGGLLQIAQNYSIRTKLICLTKGGRNHLSKNTKQKSSIKNIRIDELKKSCNILGIDEHIVFDCEDGNLIKTKDVWLKRIKKEIKNDKPNMIITFDQSGITGHPDHLVVSKEIIDICKSDKNIKLLLRVPDKQELIYFKSNKAIKFAQKATHKLSYTLKEAIIKIKAILAHKSQLKSFLFSLQIIEWYLFDHRELYHLIDFKKNSILELKIS